MFRAYHRLAVIALPLLVAGCSDDAAPVSEPRAEPQLRATTRALAPSVSRYQFRSVFANAFFVRTAPFPCVETTVDISGYAAAQKVGPGKGTTEPLADISVSQTNICTGEVLRYILGQSRDVTIQSRLAKFRLQGTIPAFDRIHDTEVQVEVDVTWTATGEPESVSSHYRRANPGYLTIERFRGSSSEAVAAGTVVIEGENLTPYDAFFAGTSRARSGVLEVVRTP